jgi:hypothetical protein
MAPDAYARDPTPPPEARGERETAVHGAETLVPTVFHDSAKDNVHDGLSCSTAPVPPVTRTGDVCMIALVRILLVTSITFCGSLS